MTKILTQKPLELVVSRTFDAPRELVFEAWSKAEHVSRWFTPRPLTTSQCELDFRPGGKFYLVMRMPNGVELPMDARFGEIVPLERITFKATIHGGNEVDTTVTFTESKKKTTITVRQTYAFESNATRGAPQGWNAAMEQLGEVLAQS
jgi:uncharacterized protein YndB with AHSA1/START domain